MDADDDSVPASYKPLPPICSETAQKYGWPTAQTREPYILEDVKTSLCGPIKSSLPEISLRYHRQSTYTDAYGKSKRVHNHGYALESCWLDPLGKQGKFYGQSIYEKDYVWPEESSKMPRIPTESTISWGILPLLDQSKDNIDSYAKKKIVSDEKIPEGNLIKEQESTTRKKKYKVKDVIPLQEIWSGETIHRRHYLIPPESWRKDTTKIPVPELKFSGGNMETTTTAMSDYQDPKYVKQEDYFIKYYVKDEKTEDSRSPFFLF